MRKCTQHGFLSVTDEKSVTNPRANLKSVTNLSAELGAFVDWYGRKNAKKRIL